MRSHLGKHLLHSLLVGLDVLDLPLKAVLHLVLDKVDADPRLPVLDALIVDPIKSGNTKLHFWAKFQIPEWPFSFSDGMLKL